MTIPGRPLDPLDPAHGSVLRAEEQRDRELAEALAEAERLRGELDYERWLRGEAERLRDQVAKVGGGLLRCAIERRDERDAAWAECERLRVRVRELEATDE
jgi:hypothetical protein